MSKDYSNWCPEIYRSVFLDKFNDNMVRVAPCCQADVELEPVEDFDFVNSPYLTRLRQQFDLGQKPNSCSKCWDVEKIGHKSRRISAVEFFSMQPSSSVALESIDHSATWACNLACIMCGENQSSFWASQLDLDKKDLQKIGRLFQKSNNILNKVDVSQIKKIHFNGGEPMINNDQTDLLVRLDNENVLQNVFISYNTNASIMPSQKIIDLWSRAKLVKIFFSIDAVESAFEYIRWPAQWNEIENNMQIMKQRLPGNVMFGINCTVGSYNLLEIDKVYHWYKKNIQTNREGDVSDFCWQLADNFPVGDVPLHVKHQAIDRLNQIPALQSLATHIHTTINSTESSTWITTLDNLDAKRNTNWRSALEISNHIEVQPC